MSDNKSLKQVIEERIAAFERTKDAVPPSSFYGQVDAASLKILKETLAELEKRLKRAHDLRMADNDQQYDAIWLTTLHSIFGQPDKK